MISPPPFRELLARQAVTVGTFCVLGSIEGIEIVCHAGFDFVVVDGQHGAFSLEAMRHAIRATDAAGVCAAARLPANGWAYVEPLLDAGYSTLIAPMINSVDDARAFVRAAYYPPLGLRSQSGCRASLRGGAGYPERINENLVLLAMIEHIEAIEQCGEILAETGISGCLIGTTDLRSSLRGSDASNDRIERAIARVRSAAKTTGKAAGIAAGDIESAKRFASDGFRFILQSSDRQFLQESVTRAAGAWKTGDVRG